MVVVEVILKMTACLFLTFITLIANTADVKYSQVNSQDFISIHFSVTSMYFRSQTIDLLRSSENI